MVWPVCSRCKQQVHPDVLQFEGGQPVHSGCYGKERQPEQVARSVVKAWVGGCVLAAAAVCLWLAVAGLDAHFKSIDCCRGVWCPPEKLCAQGR